MVEVSPYDMVHMKLFSNTLLLTKSINDRYQYQTKYPRPLKWNLRVRFSLTRLFCRYQFGNIQYPNFVLIESYLQQVLLGLLSRILLSQYHYSLPSLQKISFQSFLKKLFFEINFWWIPLEWKKWTSIRTSSS